MNVQLAAMGSPVRKMWNGLSWMPGGRRLFSYLVGRVAPYTGTVGALVEDLRPGYAKVGLRDRPAIRNHLQSVHAVALMNLAEMTTGLAMAFTMPSDVRGIVTNLSIEFIKKARGDLTAECHCVVPEVTAGSRVDCQLEAEIRNRSGVVVARAYAQWLLQAV